MAELAKFARPVMRTPRGFHPNETGRELGDKRQYLLPGEPLCDDDMPMNIDAMDAHHIFCKIDPQCCNLCHGGPSYCWSWLSCTQPSWPRRDDVSSGWVHSISL